MALGAAAVPFGEAVDTWRDELQAKYDVEIFEEMFCRASREMTLMIMMMIMTTTTTTTTTTTMMMMTSRTAAVAVAAAAAAAFSSSGVSAIALLGTMLRSVSTHSNLWVFAPDLAGRLDDERLWYTEQPPDAKLTNIDFKS